MVNRRSGEVVESVAGDDWLKFVQSAEILGLRGSRMLLVAGVIVVVAFPVFGVLLSGMVLFELGGSGFPDELRSVLAVSFAVICLSVFVLLVVGAACHVISGFRKADIERVLESESTSNENELNVWGKNV